MGSWLHCCVVFFALTDRGSTIPSNIHTTSLSIRHVVCWTGKNQKSISTKLQREHNKNKTKTTKKKEQEDFSLNTKHTGIIYTTIMMAEKDRRRAELDRESSV